MLINPRPRGEEKEGAHMEAILLSLLHLLLGMFGHFLEISMVMSPTGTALLCQEKGGETPTQEKQRRRWRLAGRGGGELLSHHFSSWPHCKLARWFH